MLAALLVRNHHRGSTQPSVDLLPWDFLTQFGLQQREYLRNKTKKEIKERLEALYEDLPQEVQERLETPKKRVVERVDGVDTIVMKVDWDALLKRAELIQQLLGILLDDEEAILVILLSEP